MKKKLKKSQALSSKEAKKSQGQAPKEIPSSLVPLEVVKVGDSNSELPELNIAISGQKRPNSARETPSPKKKRKVL